MFNACTVIFRKKSLKMTSYTSLPSRLGRLDISNNTFRTSNVWETWNVDPKYFKFIIGKGGSNIKQLQAEYQLEIFIKRTDQILKVRGSAEGKQKFRTWLDNLMRQLDDVCDEKIFDVHPQYLKHIIGKNGKNLQKLQNDFQIKIIVNNSDRTLIVKGSEEGILKFSDWLENLKQLNEGWLETQDEPTGTWDPVEFVESKYIGRICGERFVLLKYLEKKYNVKIRVKDDTFWVNGTDENKEDILDWLRQFLLTKAHSERVHDAVSKIFFIGLTDEDTITLGKCDEMRVSVITNHDAVSVSEPITFQNMYSLQQACVEALSDARERLDLKGTPTSCRVMVHTGRINFRNEPKMYKVSELSTKPLVHFKLLIKGKPLFRQVV